MCDSTDVSAGSRIGWPARRAGVSIHCTPEFEPGLQLWLPQLLCCTLHAGRSGGVDRCMLQVMLLTMVAAEYELHAAQNTHPCNAALHSRTPNTNHETQLNSRHTPIIYPNILELSCFTALSSTMICHAISLWQARADVKTLEPYSYCSASCHLRQVYQVTCTNNGQSPPLAALSATPSHPTPLQYVINDSFFHATQTSPGMHIDTWHDNTSHPSQQRWLLLSAHLPLQH